MDGLIYKSIHDMFNNIKDVQEAYFKLFVIQIQGLNNIVSLKVAFDDSLIKNFDKKDKRG